MTPRKTPSQTPTKSPHTSPVQRKSLGKTAHVLNMDEPPSKLKMLGPGKSQPSPAKTKKAILGSSAWKGEVFSESTMQKQAADGVPTCSVQTSNDPCEGDDNYSKVLQDLVAAVAKAAQVWHAPFVEWRSCSRHDSSWRRCCVRPAIS